MNQSNTPESTGDGAPAASDAPADSKAAAEEVHDELTLEVNLLADEKSELEASVRSKTAELDRLSDRVQQAEAVIEESGELGEAVASLRKAHGALRSQVNTLREEAEQWGQEIELAQEQLGTVEAAVKTAKEQRRQAEEKAREAEAEAQEWETLKAAEKTELQQQLQQREDALEEREAALEDAEKAVKRDRKALEKEKTKLASAQEKVKARKTELSRLEKEARSNRKRLEGRDKEVTGKLAELAKREEDIRRLEQEAATEAERIKGTAASEVERARAAWSLEKNEALQEAWAEVRARKESLDVRSAELAALEDDLKEEHASVSQKAERLAGKALVKAREELASLRGRVEVLRERSQQLDAENRALRDAELRTKDRDLVELDAELEEYREKVQRLEGELEERPPRETGHRLETLLSERDRWDREREQLQTELRDLSKTVDQRQEEAFKHADLRRQLKFWKAQAGKLGEQLDELTRLINRDHIRHTPFARCAQLDDTEALRQAPAKLRDLDGADALADFVEEIRQRLAYEGLYYETETLRLYLAGLSMSRLVLLEGMPGTGKTTLAKAFADAIGTGHGIIEVQSGWRDRHDILGHYNPFERQFNETDFLEHLYRSQTPAYAGRPYFIVLDEVNLSRPEYYFADFLSALERQEMERGRKNPKPVPITLTPRPFATVDDEIRRAASPGERPPALPHLILQEEGKGAQIHLPSNVWFVGTANQDESTLAPAPKTYDRAHVQVLPVLPPLNGNPKKSKPSPTRPIGLEGLEKAFSSAANAHAKETKAARAFFDAVQPTLERYRIGWSNRLVRQISRFVPTYLAAGPGGEGALAEAVDHLLVTKVLYKAEGKFHIRPTHIADLKEIISIAAEDHGWSLAHAERKLEQIKEDL